MLTVISSISAALNAAIEASEPVYYFGGYIGYAGTDFRMRFKDRGEWAQPSIQLINSYNEGMVGGILKW